MASWFEALRRWLFGAETTTTRNIVKLDNIRTWTDIYNENREEFVDSLNGIEELQQYTEDQAINAKVSIHSCDITSLQVDGIVRSTNTSLTSTEGISGAIKTAAGPKLNTELKSLGGCRAGEAKTTSGFDLPAKYIVHTVGPKKELPDILERCYKNCLEQMKSKNMKSLAFCCISTGNQGYPNGEAAKVALKAVRLWLEDLKTENKLEDINRIVFCLFSDMDVMMYSIWMQIFFPCSPEQEPKMDGKSPSGPNSGEFEGGISLENTIQAELKERKLCPLPGFIEMTSEPDMISFDDDPNTKRAKMPCGHVIGPESMTDYFRNTLTKGRSKLICPDKDCNQEWDYFLVRHVACFTEEDMRLFEKNLAKNYLLKEKGTQMCPGCKTWCVKDPRADNCVRCQICTKSNGKKFDFCWVCLNKWNNFFSSKNCGNLACGGKDNRIKILAKCPTKKIDCCDNCPTIRGCPKCGILVEHKENCGHMSCRSCQYEFCFICLKERKNGNVHRLFGACVLAPFQSSLPGSK